MSYRYDKLAPGEIYHICTRGVENRKIYRNDKDFHRFTKLMLHCLDKKQKTSFSFALRSKQEFMPTKESEGLVDVLCYCLMSNHIHLLLKQNFKNGISRYMQKLLNSYAKFFNMSEQRVGSLFANPFKAVLVDSDEQLLHVSRYIHLNPYKAHMSNNVFDYKWSSLDEYSSTSNQNICHNKLIGSILNKNEYKKFVNDEADYARSVEDNKYVLIDYE